MSVHLLLPESNASENRKTPPPPPIKDDGSLDYDGKIMFLLHLIYFHLNLYYIPL